ncbi:MAG: F0F1 ATP synthase subunit B [Rhodospirillales bacterium 20-60-12]|nr:MAG: F0F1 ATP synthase subunit B [Rhodospirillales bacterium 20-60-12]HQT68410.1 ATP synthase F0 subunit B [Acetobacteraceae bacterium]
MQSDIFSALPWQTGKFWVTVAILLFIVLFGRKILGAVTAMLDSRSAEISAALAEAARLKAEAEAMLRDAQAKSAKASEQAKELLAEAQAEAKRISADLTAEAHATAKRREALAMLRIETAEKNAVDEVRFAAADLAARAVESYLRDNLTADQDIALTNKAIAGIPAALAPRRAA